MLGPSGDTIRKVVGVLPIEEDKLIKGKENK
jgi:hypothetical protein